MGARIAISFAVIAASSLGCGPPPRACAPIRVARAPEPAPLLTAPEPAPPAIAPPEVSVAPTSSEPAEYAKIRAAIEEETPLACAAVDAKYPLSVVEPDVLRQIHLARAQSTLDGISEIEAAARARAIFEDAVEHARTELRWLLAPSVDDVFLSRPRVVAALRAHAIDEHADVYVYPARLTKYFNSVRTTATTAARSSLSRANAVCVDRLIERERGRWLAIFKGKL